MNWVISKRTVETVYVGVALLAYSGGIYTLFFPPDPLGDGGYQQNFVAQLINFPAYFYAIHVLIFHFKSVLGLVKKTWLLWVVVAMCFLSVLWSIEPMDTLRRAMLLLISCAFGIAIAARFSASEFLALMAAVFLGLAASQLIALLTMPGLAIHQDQHYPALRGFFAHKNMAGRTMAIGFLIGLCLHAYKEQRTLARAVMVMCLIVTIATLSRTAMASVVVLILLYIASGFIYRHRRIGVYMMVVSISFVFLMIGSGILVELFTDFVEYSGRDMTLTGRTYLWQDVADRMTGMRFWLGYGYEAFWRSEEGARGMRWWSDYIPPHAHNGFVHVWVAIGTVGLGLMVLLVSRSLGQVYYNLLATNTAHSRAAFTILHGHLLVNITEQSMLVYGNFLWLFFVVISSYTAMDRAAARPARSTRTMVSFQENIRS